MIGTNIKYSVEPTKDYMDKSKNVYKPITIEQIEEFFEDAILLIPLLKRVTERHITFLQTDRINPLLTISGELDEFRKFYINTDGEGEWKLELTIEYNPNNNNNNNKKQEHSMTSGDKKMVFYLLKDFIENGVIPD